MKNTINSKEFGSMFIKDAYSCGDAKMNTEIINGVTYDIYLGYCGYVQFYAVKRED